MEQKTLFQYLYANGCGQDLQYLRNVFSANPAPWRVNPLMETPIARSITVNELRDLIATAKRDNGFFLPETLKNIRLAADRLHHALLAYLAAQAEETEPVELSEKLSNEARCITPVSVVQKTGNIGLGILPPEKLPLFNQNALLNMGTMPFFSAEDPEESLYAASLHRPEEINVYQKEGREKKQLKKMHARTVKANGPNPAKMAEILWRNYPICICREMVVYFDLNENHYRFLSKTAMLRLIKSAYHDIATEVGSSNLIREIYEFLYHEKSLVRDDTWFRQSYNFIAFHNGTLELSTGRLLSPSPAFAVLNAVRHCLDLGASIHCPKFDAFLQTIAGSDPTLVQRIWEVIGYCISNDMRGRAIILFQGVSASGKSTLANFIISLFSAEAIQSIQLEDISNNFVGSAFFGKALVVSLDLANTALNEKNVGFLKSMSGNDLISSDVKYGNRYSFYPTWKILLASNSAFSPRTPDNALLRRIVVVPFRYSIPQQEWNLNLLDAFEKEKNSIIRKALLALENLRRNNYIFSGADEYKINDVLETASHEGQSFSKQSKSTVFSDLIGNFIKTYYIFTDSEQDICFKEDIYDDFCIKTNNESVIDFNLFSRLLYSLFSDLIGRTRTRVNSDNGMPKPAFTKIKKKSVL